MQIVTTQVTWGFGWLFSPYDSVLFLIHPNWVTVYISSQETVLLCMHINQEIGIQSEAIVLDCIVRSALWIWWRCGLFTINSATALRKNHSERILVIAHLKKEGKYFGLTSAPQLSGACSTTDWLWLFSHGLTLISQNLAWFQSVVGSPFFARLNKIELQLPRIATSTNHMGACTLIPYDVERVEHRIPRRMNLNRG